MTKELTSSPLSLEVQKVEAASAYILGFVEGVAFRCDQECDEVLVGLFKDFRTEIEAVKLRHLIRLREHEASQIEDQIAEKK